MLRERKIWYRRAAEEPVIHADRSEDQRSNSQTADKIDLSIDATNDRFAEILIGIGASPRLSALRIVFE